MKHLPLSLAGALFLAGSMAVYAQAQQPPKEPMVEEQKPAQGARKPQPSSEEQKPTQGARKPQPSSEEGQGERAKSGQSGQSEGKSSQDDQRRERPEKSGTAEGTDKQRRDQDSSGSAGAASQEEQRQRAQQGGDGSKGESRQKHAGKKLEAKQRTVVKETIVKRNVRPVKVNFSINVGTVIPRSVTLYDLPPTLIEYEPSYSRYTFILADDDTILVIDPESWTIVDVIDI
jgi:type IV secretory pathway VirB10-like protein